MNYPRFNGRHLGIPIFPQKTEACPDHGSESICNHRGGACPDCILIPENACITRNELLSRSVLIGRGVPRWDATAEPLVGYYDIARQMFGGPTGRDG